MLSTVDPTTGICVIIAGVNKHLALSLSKNCRNITSLTLPQEQFYELRESWHLLHKCCTKLHYTAVVYYEVLLNKYRK